MSIKKYAYQGSQAGVSLLETLIFMTVLSTIIIAIVYSTTLSLKRAQFNQKKIFATRFAQETEDWMQGEKETNWTTFLARSPGSYCMNASITDCMEDNSCWDVNTACASGSYTLDEGAGLNNGFKRDVTLTTNGSRVDVHIVVEWQDGPNTFDVSVDKAFSRWE